MLNTDNFGLRLPIRGVDRANVDDINYNSEVIDRVMGDNGNLVAPMFDPNRSQPYHEGDMVRQETLSGHISTYICIVPEASLTWDPSEWDVTNAAEQIQAAKESGGTEVEANPSGTPTDTLTSIDIDGSIYAVGGGSEVTKTATGNPIELTDGADAPLVKCVTQITGYQEGTGTPSPDNVRPIVAYTEGEIGVRGKNLAYLEQGTINLSTGADEPSTTRVRTNYIDVVEAEKYIASSQNNGWSVRNGFAYDASGSFLQSGIYPDATTGRLTVPTNLGIASLRFVYSHANTSETCAPSDFWYQFEQGQVATSYESYTSTTHTTTFHSAIYRGSEDVVNGSVHADWGVVDLGDLTWSPSGSAGRFYARFSNDDNVKPSPSSSVKGNYICENYNAGSQSDIADRGIDGTVSLDSSVPPFINILDTSCAGMTGADFKTHVTGVLFAYELSTPTTSSVTPTNLPIKSLSGYNHIESSTGDMEIEYITQAQQPLIDLIRAEKGDTYSTSEQIVGKWIDGSTLYRRTYEIEVQNPSAPYTQDISISGMVVVGIEKHYANYQYSGTWYYESGDQLFTNSAQYLSITQKDEAGTTLAVSSNMGNGLDAIKICFSVSYIKTASNNRSLAKGGNEQTEEIKEPEELKEEVKEEPEEKKAEEEKADETETENSER